jgi:hypothetical protein
MSEWKPLHTLMNCKEPFFAWIPSIDAWHVVKWGLMGNLWDMEAERFIDPKSVTLVCPKPFKPMEVLA